MTAGGVVRRHGGLVLLALIAYLPALASSPGRMPADTKLSLYLDPAGLVSRAASTFEAEQFAGWVPHQQIAYLWPAGPWFWVFDTIGVPDWVAHRLWIGTIMFAAGAGVRWTARLLGLAPAGATVAALVYQLSPFLLAYVSRTSMLLLPWAALGWIVGLTIRATRAASAASVPDTDGSWTSTPPWRTRLAPWRDPALIALVVATVAAVNATAVILIVPAPALWLVHSAWQRSISWRQAVAVAARVGVLALTVSLWWIGMLVVQARHGAPVLAFSETLEDVSRNSTGSEVLRTLGYWLFYQRDPVGPTTTASLHYLISLKTILISYTVVLVAVAGLVLVSWSPRRYAAMLVAAGMVLAVGVHPIGSPSPLMDALTSDDGSGLALALRSSTRAVPVMLLGLALAAGALVSAFPVHWWRRTPSWTPSPRTVTAVFVGLLAVINLPALLGRDLVDPAIDRDQDPPAAWQAAADAIDDRAVGFRALQLPGAEFGTFRWGHTTDQPLVSLADTPLVTRDLLPLGSAGAMDLLYALDDRFQEGTAEAGSVAPIARLLGTNTVVLTNDMAFERYRTARPEIVDALLTGPGIDGLGTVERFGEPIVNLPDVPMIDATSLLDARVGRPIRPLALVEVDEPVAVARAKATVVVVAGSGDGLVDAAAAGLIDGHELIRYSAASSSAELVDAVAAADLVVITDSNRDRAHHWRGSQDVHGHTEPGGPSDDVLVPTTADQRLDVFGTDDAATQTVAIQDGPVSATASSYGEPFAYLPEHRAVMAIDGDADTAWRVGGHADPTGEFIRLELDEPVAADDTVVLRQVAPPVGGRQITRVEIRSADQPPLTVELGADSLTSTGQAVDVGDLAGATTIDLTIAAVSVGDAARAASRASVGFVEIDVARGPTTEVVRVPDDASDALAEAITGPPADTATDLAVVLTRLRVDPTDVWRSDPEPVLTRSFRLPERRDMEAEIIVRLDARATDADLAALLVDADVADSVPVADRRLTGSVAAVGAAAFDDDPSTSWVTPFDDAEGATVSFTAERPLEELRLRQPSGDFSTVTSVALSDGTTTIDLDLAAADADGVQVTSVPPGLGPGVVTLTVSAVDPRRTVDRRFGDVVTLPAAFAEIQGAGIPVVPTDDERTVSVECSEDLLSIDGQPLRLRLSATVRDLRAGAAVTATACDGPVELAGGNHRITATGSGALTVDRVVLTDVDRPRASASDPIEVTVDRNDARDRVLTVAPCSDGCWVVLGEGHNDAWRASTSDGDLGAPELVDGGFNGWWLPPSATPTVVQMTWTAQTPVTVGLAIAAIAALALLAIVAVAPRRGRGTGPTTIDEPVFVDGLAARPRRPVATLALVAIAAGVLIAPVWAAAAVGVMGLALVIERWAPGRWTARIPEVVGWCGAAGVAVAVLLIERRDRPFPNAGWTTWFEHLDGLARFAVLLIAAGAMRSADGRSQPPPNPRPTDDGEHGEVVA